MGLLLLAAYPRVGKSADIPSDCAVMLRPTGIVNNAVRGLNTYLVDGKLMPELLRVSPEFRRAMDLLLNPIGTLPTERPKVDAMDLYLELLQYIQNLPNPQTRTKVADFIGDQARRIFIRYQGLVSTPTGDDYHPGTLRRAARLVFSAQSNELFSRHLKTISLGKIPEEPFVTAQPRPHYDPPVIQQNSTPLGSVDWIPAVLRSPDVLPALLVDSSAFREWILEFINIANRQANRPLIEESIQANDLYIELIRTLQNPGSRRRMGAASRLNNLVESVLNEYALTAQYLGKMPYLEDAKVAHPYTLVLASNDLIQRKLKANPYANYSRWLIEADEVFIAPNREGELRSGDGWSTGFKKILSRLLRLTDELNQNTAQYQMRVKDVSVRNLQRSSDDRQAEIQAFNALADSLSEATEYAYDFWSDPRLDDLSKNKIEEICTTRILPVVAELEGINLKGRLRSSGLLNRKGKDENGPATRYYTSTRKLALIAAQLSKAK